METEKRESGISVVGKIPWGTHFCFFYETEQDLLDTLVPYFKAGLENNEFCMWVVSPPSTQQETAAALRQALPELDRHLAQRNIEILFYDEWYLHGGVFELPRVIEKWKNKVAEALARGYAGLRGIGNEDWLTEEYWKEFAQYEKELDRWIANQRMLAACTYSLALRGVQVFDVANTHEYAIAKRQGIWQVLETPELVQTKAEIKRLNEELEERVTQRTRELTATNRELRAEITERNRVEESLRQTQARGESVLAAVSDTHILFDHEWHYIYVNAAAAKAIGQPPEQIRGRTLWELFPEIVGSELDRQYRRAMEQRVPVSFQFHYLTRDTWWENRFYPTAEGLAVYASDITERKHAEERLGFHATLLENVHDAIIAADKELRVTAWNRAAEKMYGWTEQEVLGRDLRDVVRSEYSETQRAEAFRVLAETGQFQVEVIHHRKDGMPIYVGGAIITLRDTDANLTGYLYAYHDITEQKRTEAAEREHRTRLQTLSNQLLVAQEEERRAIARELHDEIGQVLNAVSANLRALELSPDRTTRKERMEESLALVDEALAQIRDLSLELRPSMLDDFGLVSALEWYAKRQAQRAGFSIEFAIELRDPRLPPNLEITVFRVVQIALTNVARHAQAKQVRVALLQRDSKLELVIQDDGVGFDVDLALQRATHGATLGLLSMQERVRLARGEIEILSSDRAGTLIRARFPIE